MSKIVKTLKEIIANKSFNGKISRVDIIRETTTKDYGVAAKDLIAYLSNECTDCAVSQNATSAIVYDSEKVLGKISSSETKNESVELSAPITKMTQKDFSEIDSSKDPREINLIKTASFTALEELICKDNPLNIYISGPTGVGKTVSILYLAKSINKPVIRVNLSASTDIDDLLGGLRIVNGDTVFDPGPVAIAMEMGAILLLDEVDAGRPQVLLDLHPVLENRGVLAKKARRMIYPTPGFQVIASGNTKGSGDMTGKYIGTNHMNAAFLSRFDAWLDWGYPTKDDVKKMIRSEFPMLPSSVKNSISSLYGVVLENFNKGTSELYIEPRKILSIARICKVFNASNGTSPKVKTAIQRSLGAQEPAVVEALILLYDTVAEDTDSDSEQTNFGNPPAVDENGNPIPF